MTGSVGHRVAKFARVERFAMTGCRAMVSPGGCGGERW
ncbi:hypothetical protein LI99_22760 [Mycolicibacterium smegmatis]|uniref:Uncharacterized protein n=2 Tax=Mycolicibacterium smegmatis (strain ATCC 700084 / mc(2)155) TaxID=246196 RepID=A0R131_MYCS2|nr:hypothetical protein MSMEG_4600 [Mycolicibacterium smegmatis MC2 155]AIU16292.1 hypothetical protein LI99_22760 [Mycolicibacterium smegmatis]AFP40939.1 hypothetical protein MSMEI_4485 [Mycolicibacterium smegmatis MC2 155]AIU09667.1 hypothetical protein LJ00_22755 [Mycolicibacterium smegmatis MC2 155]AIU22915.1 hypothetical protein LI98_22765 [Mycolicibacterium smegmatis]